MPPSAIRPTRCAESQAEKAPDPDPDPNPNPCPDPNPNPDPNLNPDPYPDPEPDPNPNPNPDQRGGVLALPARTAQQLGCGVWALCRSGAGLGVAFRLRSGLGRVRDRVP